MQSALPKRRFPFLVLSLQTANGHYWGAIQSGQKKFQIGKPRFKRDFFWEEEDVLGRQQ
jgi:hypothetical protein